jgi:uncharacterized protein YcfJ
MKQLLIIPALLGLAACQTTTQPAKVYYPVQKCGYVDVPVYGVLDRPASGGEVVGGAVIGGVLGNVVSEGNDGATIVGAIIGGALANQRKQEQVIVGYNQEYQCWTEYK